MRIEPVTRLTDVDAANALQVAKDNAAATKAVADRRPGQDIRAMGSATIAKYGTVANVLAAVKRAQESAARSDEALDAWHVLALTAQAQKVSDRAFTELVPGTTKHTLPRLVKGATLAAKYRSAGFAVSSGKCQTFADRATVEDMKTALANVTAKAMREGSDPVALGIAKAKAKATPKATPKAKSGSAVTLTIKPEQFGAALDIILARVADIPAKQKAHALETARAIVAGLEG